MLLRNNYTSNNKFENICAFLPGYNRSDWQTPGILYTKAPTLRFQKSFTVQVNPPSVSNNKNDSTLLTFVPFEMPIVILFTYPVQ